MATIAALSNLASATSSAAAADVVRHDDTRVVGAAADSAVCHNTGAETWNGAKTFGTAPAVPVGNLLTHPVRRDDTRLTDSRTPTAHAASHAVAGSDPVTPAAIGAQLGLTPTASKTAAYTAVSGDLVLCDAATTGAFTVTLPAAAAGRLVAVKKTDAGANLVTIARAGSDTIGAAAATSVTLGLRDQQLVLQANGANWVQIDSSQPLAGLDARFAAIAADQAAGTASIRTLGTGATQAMAGNDSRVTGAAPLASPTFTGTVTAPRIITPPVALTDAATIAVDASLGNHFRVTLAGNRTLGLPTNPTDGQKILIEVIQDATGSRTLAYNAVYAFGTGVVSPTLTTAAGKRDFLGFVYSSPAAKWFCLATALGY